MKPGLEDAFCNVEHPDSNTEACEELGLREGQMYTLKFAVTNADESGCMSAQLIVKNVSTNSSLASIATAGASTRQSMSSAALPCGIR